jgi:predicted neuraminidase
MVSVGSRRKASLILVGGAGLILTAGGAARANDALPAQPGFVSAEFVFDKAPFPSCHASTIVETGGKLLAAWFGGTAERHPDVGIWLSRREQDAWSAPKRVATGVVSPTKRYPTWNPVLFQPRRGPLMLFYKVGPSPSEWWGMVMTSSDGGRSWAPPRRLPGGILGPIKNKPIELPSGDFLAPSSTEHAGWRVHFERSSDGGATWHSTGPLNDPHKIRAIQPSILVHQGGRLQAVGRTRASGIFQIWSDDGGKTWGEMTTVGLPNPSSGTDAVTLADGRHLLVYNHSSRYRGRSPLNVAVSDDGASWQAALVLEDEPGSEFSYPAVIQSTDGLVYITYTWKRKRIKHVALDPSKLRATPLVDGDWTAEGKN